MNPCHKCSDRVPGCHGSCPRYKAWKDEAAAVMQKKLAESQIRGYEGEKDLAIRKYKQTYKK